MNAGSLPMPRSVRPGDDATPLAALSVALWVFIAVASSLFALFIAACVMRAAGDDWSTLALPWPLALSTTLLALTSLALHIAARSAVDENPLSRQGPRRGPVWPLERAGVRVPRRPANLPSARPLFILAGALGTAFITTQLTTWTVLAQAHVGLAANPAASFFYLLTAMHGAHVVGGLIAWARSARLLRHAPQTVSPTHAAAALCLCARYWHFLLLVWLLLLVTFTSLSPNLARWLCSVPGAAP